MWRLLVLRFILLTNRGDGPLDTFGDGRERSPAKR